MKINILYIFWFIALIAFIIIAKKLQSQSSAQLFGIAETKGQTLKLDYTALIKKCNLKVGQQINTGDTLLVLENVSIEKRSVTENTASNQLEVERIAKNNAIDKEKSLFEKKQAAHIGELEAQIKMIQKEIDIQNNLKKAISDDNISNNSLKHQEIKSLEEEIEQIKIQTKEQLKIYNTQRINNNNISVSKAQEVQDALKFIDKDKAKLVLLAPYDGFIEDIFIVENEIVPDYKDLLKINPKEPNKIIGFIYETVNVQFNIGDTLLLSSSTRPEIKCSAQLVGASPKLVELPFRLRKYQEVKAWGREIYINLPPKNGFYIGEKVLIQMR